VAYGTGSYGAFSPFDRIRGLAKWLGVLVLVSAVVQVLSLISTYALSDEASAYLRGDISENDFISSYVVVAIVGVLSAVVSIALIVLTFIWMFRLATNNRKLGRQSRWAPGWAIGGWFCPPLVLYVIPFLMFRELWKGSDPQFGPHDSRWTTAKVSPLVTVWWLLYGILPLLMIPLGFSMAFGSVSGSSTADLAQQIEDTMAITALSTVGGVASSVAYFLLVRGLTARQTALTQES
jgi:uncharacterized BrkB/YihY/UPF0761 family membrane protein